MRRLTAVVTLVAIGLATGGCGGMSPQQKAAAAAEKRRAVSHVRYVRELADAKAESALAGKKVQDCRASQGKLVDALGELDGRLDIGLTYAAYGDKLGDVSVAYNAIDFSSMRGLGALDCLSLVGVHAENAFNSYNKAMRTWQACFDSLYCSNDDIKSSLQDRWASAAREVHEAQHGLSVLERRAATAEHVVARLQARVRQTQPPTTK